MLRDSKNYIYDYFSKQNMEKMLTAFHKSTGLRVQLTNAEGDELFSAGEQAPFCVEFEKRIPVLNACKKQHMNACMQAIKWGETYVFNCKAGLCHIVCPILYKNTIMGSVIAGPFLLDEPDSELLTDIEKKYKLNTDSLVKLSSDLFEIEEVPPEMAEQYSRLLYYLISSFSYDSRVILLYNKSKAYQQAQIGETIQQFKTGGVTENIDYDYAKEKKFISTVREGDITEAKKQLNELLAHILLFENHDLDRIRIRLGELYTVISRAAINRGADINSILEINCKAVDDLYRTRSFEDMFQDMQENLESYISDTYFINKKENQGIKRAVEYITQNYGEDISLEDVAEHIKINPSYLCVLFKKNIGMTFSQFLNKVRIDKAKQLLENTEYSVMEIAVACGFSDQSYFTKVFKKYTGVTPKKYR